MKGLIYWDTSPVSSTFTVLSHRGESSYVNLCDDSVMPSYYQLSLLRFTCWRPIKRGMGKWTQWRVTFCCPKRISESSFLSCVNWSCLIFKEAMVLVYGPCSQWAPAVSLFLFGKRSAAWRKRDGKKIRRKSGRGTLLPLPHPPFFLLTPLCAVTTIWTPGTG